MPGPTIYNSPTSAGRVIDVEHVVVVGPGEVPRHQLQVDIGCEGAVFHEEGVETGGTRASLEPQQQRSGVGRGLPAKAARSEFSQIPGLLHQTLLTSAC